MTSIGDRVKVFVEIWEKRKAGEIPESKKPRCSVCGVTLEDGNFAMIDGDLLCLNCMKGSQEERNSLSR